MRRGRVTRGGRATQLEELLEREDGVIAVHAPYFHALARPLRRRLDALRAPLVVPLPAGATPEQAEDRRERLLQLLRQAVGYEITFGDERGHDERSTDAQPSHDEAPTRDGEIWRVAGPVVVARGLDGVRLYNVVRVGDAALPGEVIRLDGERATIQVYEDTAGLRIGEPVLDTGRPLEVELGPGLLGRIFDGTQRPLEVLARDGDDPFGRPLLPRGVDAAGARPRAPVDVRAARRRRATAVGARRPARRRRRDRRRSSTGSSFPRTSAGVVTAIRSGPARLEEPVAWIDDQPVTMLSRWPVRDPRPDRQPARPRRRR